MRTVAKLSEAQVKAITDVACGDVVVAAYEIEPGKTQQTWCVDAIDRAPKDADGNVIPDAVRFTVSSPRTGKHVHTALFGRDGSVKVTAAASGEVKRAAAKPASPNTDRPAASPVKVTRVDAVAATEPKSAPKRSSRVAKVAAALDAVASAPDVTVGPLSARIDQAIRVQVRARIAERIDAIVAEEVAGL